jgi:hypothetical protein
MPSNLNNQVVGNVGLFYVCYRLSQQGWNVMPTTRNARGVDVIIYSNDTSRKYAIQVKALSKPTPVPLGKHIRQLSCDFIIVSRNVNSDKPECFILTPAEVRDSAHRSRVTMNGISYWLQQKQYEKPEYREKWDRLGEP